MKILTCITIAMVLLFVTSEVATARWTARLRVVPEGLGLKVKLHFAGRGGPMGDLVDLQFEFQNVVDETIKIDWDASSLQLPGEQRWHVVRPEFLIEAVESTMSVPAGSRKTLRVCPVQSPSMPCDSRWLERALLVEDFSLTLRLAVSTSQGPRTGEWRWDFDYHADVATEEVASPNRTLLAIGLAAAAFLAILLLL